MKRQMYIPKYRMLSSWAHTQRSAALCLPLVLPNTGNLHGESPANGMRPLSGSDIMPTMNRRSFLQVSTAITAAPAFAAADSLRKQLRITGIETDVLRMPPGRRYFDAIHEFGTEGGGVVVRVQTDGGVTGWAYSSFGTIAGGPRALEAILQNE